MSVHHSDETYAHLVARLSETTGRDIKEWCQELAEGPSLSRSEERVHWLEDEHGLAHGYAKAVVHEADRVRASRRVT